MTGSDAPTITLLSDKLSQVTHHHLLTRVLVKLDLENWNYRSWEFFFEQLCYGYEVTKYIHGFSNDAATSTPTPLTPEELKVDKIVLSWIFTTLLDTLQASLVVECPRSTKEAWDLITDIVKDNKRKIESIATILTSLGSPVSSEDVVTFALKGLPDKYDNVCSIIHHRDTFPDLKTTRSMLTTEEMRLKSKSLSLTVDSSSSSPMVLIVKTVGIRMLLGTDELFSVVPHTSPTPVHSVTYHATAGPPLVPHISYYYVPLPHSLSPVSWPHSYTSTLPGFNYPPAQQQVTAQQFGYPLVSPAQPVSPAQSISHQAQHMSSAVLDIAHPRSTGPTGTPGQETILPHAFTAGMFHDPSTGA
ncbi:hypothetical protein Tco_0628239 [Tanacetum coccineum]|uniref:Hybrid signal transduction histidine kinase M n=1 Tax=Tanacetum coccineum TaxID=301880 RepID=A0ABQ4WPR2_9ASTR